MNRRFALVFALGLSTLATVAHVETAEAGRHRFGGGGRVHVRVSGNVGVRFARPAYYPRYRGWSTGGRIYVGPSYRYRSYRPYYYAPVPSYYGYYESNYYPVQPTAVISAPSTVVVAAPRQELPRFGIGLFAGGVSVEDQDESTDIGVLGRFRITDGLLIEGEIGKTSYENDLRVDRRLGGSLIYEIGAHNRFAPYVLAGLGVQQAEIADGEFTTRQNFGELGVGLRFALSRNFHIAADLRAGSRQASDDTDYDGVAVRSVNPPPPSESEEYSRARLTALLYF